MWKRLLTPTALVMLSVTLPAADYSSTVLSLNPVGYWRLNETTPVPLADEAVNSGSAGDLVNGFYRGTAGTTFAHPTTPGALTGNNDGMVTFAGNTSGGYAASGWMSVPYSPLLNTPVFTAEAWLNPAQIDGTLAGPLHCAFSCGDFASPRAGWLVYQSGEGWNLRMYNRNGTATSLSISGGGAPVVGNWYHVVVVFDGTTARLYINGAQVASGNPTSYVPGSAGDLAVGTRADAFFGWNGGADEVAFYTNVLSANTVAAHYSAASTNGAGYFAQILADKPVAYYHLSEPIYTAPDPSTLPVAANIGTLGSVANGIYEPGVRSAVGGPPYSGLGVGNTAPGFIGVVGNVLLGNPPELNFTNKITVMAWIKPLKTDGLRDILAHGYITTPNCQELYFRINAGAYELGSCATGEGVSVPNQANLDVGNWVFLAGTYDGAKWNLYRYGVLIGSATGPAGAGTVDSTWSIGSRGDPTLGDGRFFGGGIDEVAIFTNALTQTQIQTVLNSANTPPIIVQQPQAPAGTILAGAPVTLTCSAVGTPTLGYQWTKNGTNLVGQSTPALYFANISTNDSGNYAIVVTNAYGSVTSSIATLTVTYPTTPAALVNAFGYPAYDPVGHSATLTQVTLEFSAPLGPEGSNPAHYAIPGLTVSAAQFTNLNMTVILTTTPQTQGALYTVTVTGVTDGVGRPLAVNTAQFRAWVANSLSGVRFEYYPAEEVASPYFPYTAVAALTHNSLFPDFPVLTTNLWAFDSRIIFPDDSHDSYGVRMRGVFVPAATAQYRFFLRSDDASQLFLNPNGLDPAGKQKILEETGCCGDWNKFASAAYSLAGGQPYYIEMLYKEGGGGDYGKVAVIRVTSPGTTNYPPTGISNLQIDPSSMAGPAIGYPYAPLDAGGGLTLDGPYNATVQANHPTNFNVVVANPGGWPLAYQWLRNGAPISDATNSIYTLVPTAADNSARFTVQVSKLGSTLVSAQATLTVNADTDAPAITTVRGSTTLNTVVVSFNELMSSPAASSFTIAGHTATAAVLDSSGTNVLVTFDPPLAPGQTYNLSVQNVMDLTGNNLASASSSVRAFVFSRGLLRFDYFGGLSVSDNNMYATLLADPRFPKSPDWTGFLTAFDSRTIFPDDSHRGYGDYITGLLVPPATGSYIFYLKSDDSSDLFLNTLGSDPVAIPLPFPATVEESTCCHNFADVFSSPQALVASNMYAVAAVHKEGGGGDSVQVAAKLETNPADPNSLQPIPGSMVGVLADPVGASITITQQPVSAVGVYVGAVLNTDFNANNGGFSVVNYGTTPGPWSYNATAGSWTNFGPTGCGGPFGSGLRSPLLTIRSNTPVVLTFAHRYSFEYDTSANYDGGQVRLSVNGGSFATVQTASFSSNPYGGTIGGTIFAPITATPGWVNQAFVQQSAGYATRALLTSVATLGTFNPGDTIQIEFLASWDECSEGTEPNWEIDSVQVAGGGAVLPATVSLTVGAQSTYLGQPNRYISYFWQRDTGSGFADIAGAVKPAYTFYPGLADSGARYRCTLYSPGASATTDVATVTVTLPLYVAHTAPDTLTLSWPIPTPPLPPTTTFLLEKSPSLAPASWTTVPSSGYLTTSETVYTTVTISSSGPTQFYRLRRN